MSKKHEIMNKDLKKSINILTICIFSSEIMNLKKMQMCFYVLHLNYIIDEDKFKKFLACHMLMSFSF
jgi:hypothetical protein